MTTPDLTATGGHLLVPQRAVLSLGSNLGDRLSNLQEAIDALFDAPGLTFVALSPVYETTPYGGPEGEIPEQDDYLNVVLVADTSLAPRVLLERVLNIENSMQRVREVRWGPRTLDIDIVMFGNVTCNEPDLILPHPRAHERAFVLVPWADIEPDVLLPGHGRVADLAAAALRATGPDAVRRRDDLTLQEPA
ncbi:MULTISPECIES: 2-amino-4-hydroxy-6-hydroxymethyldihydropteridine diphosphokinase [Thermomonospora]|uniref:2-amino-4-hydroxy-6-hydroxymethyldihydropteridine diphosphokinase n=1 Tax=Thermomonospora curvata (strain ATCC 19995 / DSM 43183 / JCM 3096 / KCTC 9072 / NBRC 15933 / NCIMB 10081 / Henssen B9) TaxID=471852 RepID=D1A542_THECD|nr:MULTISPECIES: 2-amino-4-hydroxy-6-hydroxymethyldihydropteridine diphosphokinase [Thermomonospora]ACZ00028.1 2-amino-4-hydroxy-6-hydroxymethyldihydropteridin epyrophosphokinase [Thermomonospora curvata DSM 43183]PKK12244.1 MAG: 2-amino-4-hydroxy-6-hydroxymethyldihydropteridine diphosphokinase [Thermomonospora sp. CIF 1]